MYNTFNQWNTAEFLYNQLEAKDRLEYKFAEAVISFIKYRHNAKKKHA